MDKISRDEPLEQYISEQQLFIKQWQDDIQKFYREYEVECARNASIYKPFIFYPPFRKKTIWEKLLIFLFG